MVNTNKLNKSNFVEAILTVSFSMAIVYRLLCFTDLPGLTTFQSKLAYWILFYVFIAFGVYITFKNRRSLLSVCVTVALPFEIYTMMATYSYISKIYGVVILIAIVLSLAYFALVVFQKITHKRYVKEIMQNRVKHALFGARTIITVVLLCVTVPVCVNLLRGEGLVRSDVETTVDSESDEWSLSNNIETVALLHEDNWKTLSTQEKLDVLGVVKNIEMRYLGINREIKLVADNLEEGTLGVYKENDKTIVLDIEHLANDNSEKILTSLTHECKHVYDMACVDVFNSVDDEAKKLRLFTNIAKYDKEFSNYIDGNEDEVGYYYQLVEISAREYSKSAVEEYFDAINRYLANPSAFKTEE